MRYLLTLPFALIRLILLLAVFCVPVLGFWVASSLAAYINASFWLVVGSGILFFPLLPIAWDLYANRKRPKQSRILTWGDRLLLRTLVLNLAFIICLLALRPQTAFLALSTRGDWMLQQQHGAPIEFVRTTLFGLANRLEWLYTLVRPNPFEQYADRTETAQPSPRPSPALSTPVPNTPQPNPSTPPRLRSTPAPTSRQPDLWKQSPATLHPAVAKMPATVETSITSVAQYLAQQEQNPVLRVKALHDYVADRIAYDAPSYFAGQYPPQDAQTVFTRRTAVCAGYAKLLEALGQAIGIEIVYVVGDARTQTSDLSGQGHAWNAVQIEGQWHLTDVTWDSGSINASSFKKQYRADYLMPPPAVLAVSHFPQNPDWLLLPTPLSRGEFLRQPMLQPQFFSADLKLISPTRSQTEVQQTATVQLQNPQKRWLLAAVSRKGESQSTQCGAPANSDTSIVCPLPERGAYDVRLFSGQAQSGSYTHVAHLEFNRV
jgi:hypothetical protein